MSRLARSIKNPSTYIEEIKDCHGFGIDNITVEHRSNNKKRDYLFVNKVQCKHIPCSPTKMIEMCKELADIVNSNLANTLELNSKILIVGFAETATAIGAFVSKYLCCKSYVMRTTREDIDGSKELIRFEEEHSHATTQKLLIYDNVDEHEFMEQFNYILFVEDEISTGKTIINFIEAFRKNGLDHEGLRFGVASICNWQNEENKDTYKEMGIDRFYLLGGKLINTEAKMLEGSNIKIKEYTNDDVSVHYPKIYNVEMPENLFKKTRLGYFGVDNFDDYEAIFKIVKDISSKAQSIRVIGTEEFMALPILIGKVLENSGKDVICHATTRSKIDVMNLDIDGESSGIKSRHKVVSAYDSERKTYIYNTGEEVDLTIVISDTRNKAQFKRMLDNVAGVVDDSTGDVVGINLV